MTGSLAWLNPAKKPVPWISGILVLLGFLLPVREGHPSWWAILLTGLGTFGPGLLRELGWLKDKDEFQLQAARRAGYHAFLAAGLVAFLWIAFVRSGDRQLKNPQELATFFAALLWFTWMLSSLATYWGARKMAFRVLTLYGAAWLLFNILSHWKQPLALFMQCLLTAPFFGGAWLSRRWPRSTGILLLGASGFFLIFIGRLHHQRGFPLVVTALTLLLFVGPLVASGLALLPRSRAGEEAPEA
ncbi:MAG: hypothetical protein HY823_00775 [Acidobacteria bacterium]|nr:hypothetical protein [Acidobacteriota bacterium]